MPNESEGDAIVSLDSMLPSSKDGNQVDKNGRIVYNIEGRAEEMFT